MRQTVIKGRRTLTSRLKAKTGRLLVERGNNLIGKKFNKLLVIKEVLRTRRNFRRWECLCDCGNIKHVEGVRLTSRQVQSCGCLLSPNITGQIFGSLIVLFYTGEVDKHGNKKVVCACSCGKQHATTVHSLLRGQVKSCGCAKNKNKTKDISGKNFGCLTAISLLRRDTKGRAVWSCRCECGKNVETNLQNLQYKPEKRKCTH